MSIKRFLQISSIATLLLIIGSVAISGLGYISWAAYQDLGRWGFLFPTFFIALGVLTVVGLPKEMK